MSNSVEQTYILRGKQIYQNEIFDYVINENGGESKGNVEFRDCVFEKPLSFNKMNIKGSLSFYKCTFSDYSIIKNCRAKNISINDCEFGGLFYLQSNDTSVLSISYSKGRDLFVNGVYSKMRFNNLMLKKLILKDVNLYYAPFESEINFCGNSVIERLEVKSSSLYSNLNFESGEFNTLTLEGDFYNKILFKDKLKIESLFFESSMFTSRIDIEEGNYGHIYFYRSQFKGLIWINGYNYIEDAKRDLKIKELSFHSCIHEQNVSIQIIDIERLSLSNNNFKQLLSLNSGIGKTLNTPEIDIDINGINLGNIIICNKLASIHLSDINFGNIYFRDVNISHLTIMNFHNKGVVSFSNVDSGDFMVIQDSTVGNLDFLNVDVNIFKEIVFANVNLNGANFIKYPNNILSYASNPVFGYGIIDKRKWNSNLKNIYNQLKKIAKSKGDIDVANKYQSLEFKHLFLEKNFGLDKILLFFNWISNNHGRSWFRGVLFTLFVYLFFYNIYLLILPVDSLFNKYFENYIIFVSSFPKLELEKYDAYNSKWQVRLVIWLARIFVSYGIYQTIAAFRKYGKG